MRVPLVATLAVVAAACGEERAPPPPPVSAAVTLTPEELRARTSTEFEHASMLRPDPQSVPGFNVYSAPLFLIEHEGGVGDTVPAPPVAFARGKVTLRGREYDQIAFTWSPLDATGTDSIQGLRLTYGSDGFPVIQEVLITPGGARAVYVMEQLEAAARAEFGEPLPGRVFSIEGPINAAPELVIPNLLRPGPEPTGPWILARRVAGGPDDVVALLCRCSPSQTEKIEGVGIYALVPIEDAERAPAEFPEAAWLERALRLPAEF